MIFLYKPRQPHPEDTDFYKGKNQVVNVRESTRII